MLDAFRGSDASVSILKSYVPFAGREGYLSKSPNPILINSA